MVYERIRELREDNDIKQKVIADYLGVAQNTYSQYETGILNISVELLWKLADFYDTSIDYLLELTDNPLPYERSAKRTSQ